MKRCQVWLWCAIPWFAHAQPVLKAGLWSLQETHPVTMLAPGMPRDRVREQLRAAGMRLGPAGTITHMCFPQHVLGAGDANMLAKMGPQARVTYLESGETGFHSRIEWSGGQYETRYRWLQADCEELAVMQIAGVNDGAAPTVQVQPQPATHQTAPSTLPTLAATPQPAIVPDAPKPVRSAAPAQVATSPAAVSGSALAAGPGSAAGSERKMPPAASPVAAPTSARSSQSAVAPATPPEPPAARSGKAAAAKGGGTPSAPQYTPWLNFRNDKQGLQYRLALLRQEGDVGHLQLQLKVNEEAHCFDPRCDGYVLVLGYPEAGAAGGNKELFFRVDAGFRGPYTYPEPLRIELKTWPDGSARRFDPQLGLTVTPANPMLRHPVFSFCLDDPLKGRSRHQCSSYFKPEAAIAVH